MLQLTPDNICRTAAAVRIKDLTKQHFVMWGGFRHILLQLLSLFVSMSKKSILQFSFLCLFVCAWSFLFSDIIEICIDSITQCYICQVHDNLPSHSRTIRQGCHFTSSAYGLDLGATFQHISSLDSKQQLHLQKYTHPSYLQYRIFCEPFLVISRPGTPHKFDIEFSGNILVGAKSESKIQTSGHWKPFRGRSRQFL